jgi:hypothetical protein
VIVQIATYKQNFVLNSDDDEMLEDGRVSQETELECSEVCFCNEHW